jgi:hypothetical protein
MPPRFLPICSLALLLVAGSAYSGDKKKPSSKKVASKAAVKKEKSWAMLVDHVLTKGKEWPMKAPSTRTLGYDSDLVPTKSLGIDQEKSADNREHTVNIVYENGEKGKPRAKEMVLANIRVVEKEGKEIIDAYRARATLDGKLIRGMHSTGAVGEVIQTPLDAESEELKSVFETEKDLYLKKADWSLLTPE